MPDLLDRELSEQEQAVKEKLERLVLLHGASRDLDTSIRLLLSEHPDAFCAAMLSVIGSSLKDTTRRRQIYEAVADCPEFWIELTRPGCFSRAQLIEICRHLMGFEKLLDVRLAHLTAARDSEEPQLDPDTVLRILDLLDELSCGTRLILLLNHLTRHPDRRIAAKATLVVGRRMRNPNWVASHLGSDNGRIRASAVEGLWGVRSPAVRSTLWAALQDKNNRVVGNALIGLHELGEEGVNEFVERMIEDSRPPFRWTAAWVMGRIGAEDFIPLLEQALRDKEAHVQRAAERALEAILHRPATAEGISETGSRGASDG